MIDFYECKSPLQSHPGGGGIYDLENGLPAWFTITSNMPKLTDYVTRIKLHFFVCQLVLTANL